MYPVISTVLAAILDVSTPGLACLECLPQICEGVGRHVGVSHKIVRRTKQFVPREAGQFDEEVIRGNDLAAQIGPAVDEAAFGDRGFYTGDRLIVSHANLLRNAARTRDKILPGCYRYFPANV